MIVDIEKLHNRWVAVQVRPGWESRSAYLLRENGYEEFLPMYQQKRTWADRTKIVRAPLFGGYLFLRFNAHNRQPVISTPGIIRFVGPGHAPTPICDAELEALQITTKAAVTYGPCAFLGVGQEVEVRTGPLCGLRGKVVQFKNRHRLIISVSLLQRSVFAEIDGFEVAAIAGGAGEIKYPPSFSDEVPCASLGGQSRLERSIATMRSSLV